MAIQQIITKLKGGLILDAIDLTGINAYDL